MSKLFKNNILYESHLTVFNENINIEKFKQDCKVLEIKPLMLDLQNNSFHLMTGAKYVSYKEEDDKIIQHIQENINILENKGYKIIRNKLETSLNHSKCLEENNYFESHITINLQENDMIKLRYICKKNKLHLSLNTFKNNEIIVTYRSEIDSKRDFEINTELINSILNKHNFNVSQCIKEYCLFDSNVNLDKEWLNDSNRFSENKK